MKRIALLARRIYETSPASAIKAVRMALKRRLHPSRCPEVTKEFLQSAEYDRLMSRYLPLDGSYDLHEAQNETRNYLARHRYFRDQLGVFRWRGIQRHRDLILDKICKQDAVVIDFGGAACPLRFGSHIVDHLEYDARGRRVPFHSLSEVSAPVDVIFTSHTLEHIKPLHEVMADIAAKLKPSGYLLAHVPSFTCDRWWPGNHTNVRYHDHVWAFTLTGHDPPVEIPELIPIDEVIATHLEVELAEFCGDDSIFLVARRSRDL